MNDKLKRLLRNLAVQHIYLEMGKEENKTKDQLLKIKHSGIKNFFVCGSMNNIEFYISQVIKLPLFSYYSFQELTLNPYITHTTLPI